MPEHEDDKGGDTTPKKDETTKKSQNTTKGKGKPKDLTVGDFSEPVKDALKDLFDKPEDVADDDVVTSEEVLGVVAKRLESSVENPNAHVGLVSDVAALARALAGPKEPEPEESEEPE